MTPMFVWSDRRASLLGCLNAACPNVPHSRLPSCVVGAASWFTALDELIALPA